MPDPTISTLASGPSAVATTTVNFTAQPSTSLLLLSMSGDDYRTTSGSGRPESTGWTLAQSGQDFLGHYLWWKMSNGSETSVQYTIGSAALSSYALIAATNMDAAPADSSSVLHVHGGATTTTTAITPSSGRRLVVASFGGQHSGATSLGAPPSLTNGYTLQVTGANSTSPTLLATVGFLVLDGGVSTGTTTADWTINSPTCSYGILAGFKVASAASPSLMFLAPLRSGL